jgi:glycerol uptake facilitator protein
VEASGTPAAVTATARVQPSTDLARRGPEAYVAEFLGTLLLVLFIGLVLSMNSAAGLGFTDWAVIGVVAFLLLAMLIHTLGGASGGHFNPAVTVTLAALRKINPTDAAIYVGLQVVGGVAGAFIVRLLIPDQGDPVGYGAPAISQQFLEGRAITGFFVEAIGAFVLMLAYMGATVNRQAAREWSGLAIGGAFGIVVMCMGPLTGGSVNPARAFGPAVAGGSEAFGTASTFIVAFVLAPFVGALLAGMVYTAGILGGRPGRAPVDTLSGRLESPRGGDPAA